MRVLETRSYLSCRLQIGEPTANGWTVVVYPPGQEEPVALRSDDPAGLPGLLAQAKAKAAEFEGAVASTLPA
jgi:hypothetical protein